MSGALRVVDEALGLLMLLQGRVDAFADVTVKSASNSLNGLKGDVEDTLDNLNRVNEDLESLKLAKYQTLASTTLQALAIVR